MAITQLNYSPGVFEAITDEPLDDSPVLNTWYYFQIGEWKHVISDIVLKQSGTPLVLNTDYELTIDTKYTNLEENESGKTLYAKWRIINGTYDLIATTVSGNNFGTYVDNEAVENRISTFTDSSNFGFIESISRPTTTTIKIEAGSSMNIGNAFYILASDDTVNRDRATGSEFEYLYAYISGGALTFELDYSAVPVWSDTKGYWIKTGDDTRRYICSCPKDGAGNFYDFLITGAGANLLKVDWTPTADTGHAVIVNASWSASTSYQVDLSSYVYKPTVSNIIRHLLTTYWNTAALAALAFRLTSGASGYVGYETSSLRGGHQCTIETIHNDFYGYPDANLTNVYINYTYTYTKF